MAVTDLNKVLYVDADFSTAVDNIENFLDTEYPDEFNDYVNANIGQALIDIIAYAEQNLMWYLNRKVSDLYMTTAVTPNAVSKLARLLGYKPKSATYAQVDITVTLKKGPYTFPVTINKGQQFQGPNQTIWEYRGDVAIVFNPGDTSKTFTVSEGQTVTASYVSNGQNNQTFNLRGVPTTKFVAGGGPTGADFTVTVNGVQWDEYPIIPFQNINAYETNLLATPPYVKFGDGVQGAVPAQGSNLQVTYIITSGFLGRIISGGITGTVGNLVANFQNIPIAVSQPSASAGGDDPEDIRSIVANAPLFQKTQDRAITKSDYDFLSQQFPNVAMADTQVVRSVSGDATIQSLYQLMEEQLAPLMATSGSVGVSATAVSGYLGVLYEHLDEAFSDGCRSNLVQVAVLSKDASRKYVSPMQSTLDDLKAYLEDRKDVVHTLSVVDGTSNVVNADVTIDVKVGPNAVEDDVVKAISDALAKSDVAPFGILVNRDFSESLTIWEIQEAIKGAVTSDQVAYVNIKINGPSQYLDSAGNLVIPTGYVIQAGNVVVNKLPRF